jgi:uncharacterized membrane protein YphA (DoxX/SURF4 family)
MPASFDQPAWKSLVNWTAAVLSALVFLVAGLFHALDPYNAAVMMSNVKIPQQLSIPFALGLGTVETFVGVLFLIPRYRRLASWLGVILLAAYMAYIGFFYNELRGVECSCFPWVKRFVGPAFFVEDAAMMVCAIIAGLWTPLAKNFRSAFAILGAIAVFVAVSFGVAQARQSGTKAPDTVTVDGKAYPISSGHVFIYFFDPECMHCLDAGERMAKLDWQGTKFVGVPVVRPQFAPAFMERTGLKGVWTTDAKLLKDTFPYKGTPAAVAITNGRQVAELTQFGGDEPTATIRKLGFAK